MAKVWDAASGNQVLNLNRHAAEITAVGFSSDGRCVLTASNDQTAIAWLAVNISPTITLSEEPLIYATPHQPALIDGKAALQDPDAPSFGGGSLTVEIVTKDGIAGDEQLAVRDEGTGPGRIEVAGDKVVYDFGDAAGPVPIGVLSDPEDGATSIAIALTDRATKEAVQALLRSITYTAQALLTSERTVRFQLSDGDGGVGNPAERTVRHAKRETDVKRPAATGREKRERGEAIPRPA
jgi:hypothetical protein